jgi:hypothetical protein
MSRTVLDIPPTGISHWHFSLRVYQNGAGMIKIRFLLEYIIIYSEAVVFGGLTPPQPDGHPKKKIDIFREC